MRRYIILFTLLLIPFFALYAENEQGKIKAYYTKLPFEDGGYTGKYADIIVSIPSKGNFIFAREYGYQPYWQTDKDKFSVDRIIDRKGDGPEYRPDNHNICSNVALVERTTSYVKVHWRYAPDITKESFADFLSAYNKMGDPSSFYSEYVDEYFTINADGEIFREIKVGCYNLDDWNDSGNVYTQYIKVDEKGLKTIQTNLPIITPKDITCIKNEIKEFPLNVAPRIVFNFDDAQNGEKNLTVENISNTKCDINGVKAYWDKGVSGSCLNFDSYSNSVALPKGNVPVLESSSSFTISSWIAPLEYPFNTAAIVDHMNSNNGYFLGIERNGNVVFKLGTGDTVISIESMPVNLYKWSHVVAEFDSKSKYATITVNGKTLAKVEVEKFQDAVMTDLTIGRTASFKQYPKGAERDITKEFETNMVFSGLIDEIMIFDRSLSKDDIDLVYNAYKPRNMERFRPYCLPETEFRNEFGALYTKLSYNQGWDGLWRVGDYADLVVTFENNPWRYVFWRGTRYLPSLVTDYGNSGIWSNDQGPECFPGHCYEHMSDMLCRFSNIRLISSNPARVIVHWRNASVDIKYTWPVLNKDNWGVWTDEYWTIYPDGTSIRHQQIHNSENFTVIEMNQNEILHHPGQTTEDVLKDTAVIVGNHEGALWKFNRLSGDKGQYDGNLLYTNLNSSTKQFQIGEIGTKIDIHLFEDVWWNGWDHYPCQLIPSDGTAVFGYDRGGSSCVSTFREVRRKIDPVTTQAMQIYGLTRKTPAELLPLNRFWNFAPDIENISGGDFLEFVKSEKAYHILARSNEISFTIPATVSSPVVNPAFVVKKYMKDVDDVRVMVNGEDIECKKGVELDENGDNMLVVWMEFASDKKTDIVIR